MTPMNSQGVGSGVQQAGWTETNATMGNPALSGTATQPSGMATPPSRGPRTDGGMRVIDLTNAPPPPGHRQAYPTQPPAAMAGMYGRGPSPSISASGGYTATRGYGQNALRGYGQNPNPAHGQSNLQRPPANTSNSYQSFATSEGNPTQSVPSPAPSAQSAGQLTAAPQPPRMAQVNPSPAESGAESNGRPGTDLSQAVPNPPSTEPVADDLTSQPNSKLPWRTPAPRF